jgi:hypothetical protein
LRVQFGTRDLSEVGYTRDISVGGLYLVTRRVLRVGTRVHLKVVWGDDFFLSEGVVTRQPEVATAEGEAGGALLPGLGVRFVPPAELLPELLPGQLAERDTYLVKVDTRERLSAIIESELTRGRLGVPIGTNAVDPGTQLDFEIRIGFRDHPPLRGQGRVLRVVPSDESNGRIAVIEIEGALLFAQLAGLLAGTG